MAHYKFVTSWRFKQPISHVWDAIDTPEDYPKWWPSVRSYRQLTPHSHGLGVQAERIVSGFLPYALRYTTTVTRYDPPRLLAFDAAGDLTGRGSFELSEIADGTKVIIPWEVDTSGAWLNRLAPLLKWLFAANHNYVMARGQHGLEQWLKSGHPEHASC